MKKVLVALGVAALSTGAMAQNVGSSIFYNADNGHYYQRFMNNNLVSWDEAKTYSETVGGYLATITSSAEQVLIQSSFNDYTPFTYSSGFTYAQLYLGATDRETEGTWKWVTGETWSFTNWSPGEPNNAYGGNQDYLALNFDNSWDDTWGDRESLTPWGYSAGTIGAMPGFIVEYNSNPTAPGNNAVPEPNEWAAMGLLGTGLLGLVVRGRKKNLEAAK